MITSLPVSVFHHNSYAFFQSPDGLLIKVSNTVMYDPDNLWREKEADGETQYIVDINESSATVTTPFDIPLENPVSVGGSLEVITGDAYDSFYLLGETENLPAYTPFYIFDTVGGDVYSVYYGRSFETDEVLDIDAIDECYRLQNERTSLSVPIKKPKFKEHIGDRYQLVLPVSMG